MDQLKNQFLDQLKNQFLDQRLLIFWGAFGPKRLIIPYWCGFPAIALSQPNYSYGCFVVGDVVVVGLWQLKKLPFSGRTIFYRIILAAGRFSLYSFSNFDIFSQIYLLYTDQNSAKYLLFVKRNLVLTLWGFELCDLQLEFS